MSKFELRYYSLKPVLTNNNVIQIYINLVLFHNLFV